MNRKFAAKTKVSVGQSRTEIEGLLKRYGATGFGFMAQPGTAMIVFGMNDRNVKLSISFPEEDEQETRRIYRSLAMIIKAKLEAVASGVSVFEDEFLANIVTPEGDTVGDRLRPMIADAYAGKHVQLRLEGPEHG